MVKFEDERAFPVTMVDGRGESMTNLGMTLRDYFAAKAMASLTMVYWENFEQYGSGAALVKCQVETAYEMADAMLVERDNANLIAAAPKLLTALRLIQKRMHDTDRFTSAELNFIVTEALHAARGL